MQRRTLLKLGAGAAAAFAVIGTGSLLIQPGLQQGRLARAGQEVFSAVALAVLDGMLPSGAAERSEALRNHLQRLDQAIVALPPSMQDELSQLLAILSFAPGRLALAGLHAPWPQAAVAQTQAALQGMRTSRIAARQQAYHALRDLTNAAYFSGEGTWPALGYPGPRALA